MKVFLNRRPVEGPWGGGNLLVKAICDNFANNKIDVIHHLEKEIDVIFMQDPRPGNTGISINEIVEYKKAFPKTKIIHRVNECDARKGTVGVDEMLRECSKYTDVTVFVSKWMKDYHVAKGWMCANNHVIYNGVDLDHFRKRENLNNGKINIVTHHWSNNRMKGFDVYEEIDRFVEDNSNSFTFTYIGRALDTFKNTNIIEPLFGKDLGEELCKYDVYVSGSKWDPGPNHILESLACEIPTYVQKDGGGAVEFAGKTHTYDTLSDLKKILLGKNYNRNSFTPTSWHQCTDSYFSLFKDILGKPT
jgi:glycosyltransferase involved in cell wall biosynthesis